jgi:anti-repressor protein
MGALEVFSQGEWSVRTVYIDGVVWFVGRDVCAALELADPKSSLRALDEDEKGVHLVPTPGGEQRVEVG